MGIREDIKMLLARKSITMTEVAKQLSKDGNVVTVQSISKKLSKGTIKFEEVRNIVEIIGFTIEYKEK